MLDFIEFALQFFYNFTKKKKKKEGFSKFRIGKDGRYLNHLIAEQIS